MNLEFKVNCENWLTLVKSTLSCRKRKYWRKLAWDSRLRTLVDRDSKSLNNPQVASSNRVGKTSTEPNLGLHNM